MQARFILVFTLFVYLVFSNLPFTNASPNYAQELDDIVNLVKQEDLSINLWEVTAKETVTAERFTEIKKTVEQLFPQASLTKKSSENATKFSYDLQKNNGVSERLLLIIPKKSIHDIQVVYSVKGSVWNSEVRSYYIQKMATMTDRIFTDNMTQFSCVKTQPSDIIDSVYLLNNLTHKLNVQALNTIEENDFVVLSGYTSRWEAVIPTSDNPMNVQLAAREGLGGKTTITIGTPIIVTEY